METQTTPSETRQAELRKAAAHWRMLSLTERPEGLRNACRETAEMLEREAIDGIARTATGKPFGAGMDF
jgi:hypothetical protein